MLSTGYSLLIDSPALYCTLLPYTVLSCPILYSPALYCTLLPYTVLSCPTLYSPALYCTLLPYTVLSCPTLYSAALHCTLLPYTVLCCFVLSLLSCVIPLFPCLSLQLFLTERRDMLFSPEDIVLEEVIGSGAFATVYKAKLRHHPHNQV